MRRSDREITDKSEIIKIIDKCEVCRIGLSRDNIPYIVPMNFGYSYITDDVGSNDRLILYFHCAKEGKKLDIIKSNPAACFEMEIASSIIPGEKACKYSLDFESVIGMGNIVIVGDGEVEEKRKGLSVIMKKYAPEKTFEFSEAYFTNEMIDSVAILKLTVDEFTGKRRMKS